MLGESLMLAKNYTSQHVGNWFVSEKLDGMRALWDGGKSRGKLCSEISYANTEKDGRLKEAPVATGLWSRRWKPIHAPDWWLDELPNVCLDGELWMGRGRFQDVVSCCKRFEPDSRWENVEYKVFDVPLLQKEFWLVVRYLNNNFPDLAIKQEILNWKYEDDLKERLGLVIEMGGEGLMLRKPGSVWEPRRVSSLLKVKPVLWGEGVVVDVTAGKGKYVGMLGALVVKWGDVVFELSGMTDAERRMDDWVGKKVSFKYRELTRDGVPKEGRYVRRIMARES